MRLFLAFILLWLFWLGLQPTDIIGEPGRVCQKEARACAMDHAACLDGSCDWMVKVK